MRDLTSPLAARRLPLLPVGEEEAEEEEEEEEENDRVLLLMLLGGLERRLGEGVEEKGEGR